MANELRFDGRVAIVTGAGGGLGRTHALLLASRGCKVVVNDLGGSMHGGGQSQTVAEKMVEEIKAAGGEAIANADSVEDGAKIVQAAMDTWGRIDIIVNNAGILRDTSFHKMSEEDWDLIYRVHVLGGYRVTRAAWDHMRDAGYGRVVFTASAAGIYGNFGQANYSMAKLGLVGLSNTLAVEGKKKNVLVNTIAPIAGSRLTETVLPPDLIAALKPEYVSPLVALLCHESCKETGGLFEVGGGFFSKLRWERTAGKVFKLGRDITPEALAAAWQQVTNFDKTDHPADITSSMQPVLGNLSSKSKGGNEYIDVDAALGYQFPPMKTSYTERDLSLYALGIGAAENPLDPAELSSVYELHPDGFRPAPTYACVPVINAILERAKQGEQAPGLNYGFERILHGEQYTELARPLPPHATLKHESRIKDIWDKGKNAVVVIETKSYDETGDLLFSNEISMVVRGAGGWGGDRGPSGDELTPPSRKPDATIEQKIHENQALLYRLSGDWNPLHADPSFAKNFGFDKPILHGLCSFGYAARHAIQAFSKGDSRYFKSIRARFADTVFPGETLVTEMWKEGGKILLTSKVKERNSVVIKNCAVELFDEIPKKKDKPAAASASAGAAPAANVEISSADIFGGVGFYIGEHPELVSRVGTVFQFALKNPDSFWAIDVKNGQGSVKAEKAAAADVTLELDDADFLGMASGKLNPQKLYFAGKLKISGNVMAAQKLDFLTKVDPEQVKKAMEKAGRLPAGGGAPPAAAASGASVDPASLTTGDIFVAIRDYLEKNPDLAPKIATVFQFKLKDPDTSWAVDVKNGAGSVSAGETSGADVTLELADSDFLAMTTGGADPQKLYFAGKLKISGNVMASQKLMFLKKVDPAAAAEAIAKARAAAGGGGAKAPAPAAAPKVAKAPGIFKALGERLAKDASIASEVGAILQFEITEPAASFAVDLKSKTPSVKEGKAADASTTLRIADEDLARLAQGEAPKSLFQHGKLRVEGEMRAAHKLTFLKGLA